MLSSLELFASILQTMHHCSSMVKRRRLQMLLECISKNHWPAYFVLEVFAFLEQDVFERYIVYDSEEELNNPTIQRLLIKHGYTKELLEMATDISNNIIDEI